jgi:hypothetical protein
VPASVVRSVRLPPDLDQQLVKLARRQDRSINAVLVRAVRYGLPRLRPRRRRPAPPLVPPAPAPGGDDA